MSLQERTLVVKNFDPEKTTNKLLKELCIQGGPVRNVVIKPDHAFVEYEDVESVGYSKALLDGVELFGRKLIMEPKLKEVTYFKFTQLLNDYVRWDKQNQLFAQQQLQQQQLQQQQQMYQQQNQALRYQQTQLVQPSPVGCGFVTTTMNYLQPNDPTIFNQPTFAVPQDHSFPNSFVSSSIPRNNEEGFHRSRSFNHHHRPSNRNRHGRSSDWARRK